MERMTGWTPDGRCTLVTPGTPTERVLMLPKILERLAAYEDTGLEPEEIMKITNRAVSQEG